MEQTLSRVEAVVTAVNNEFVELQIVGSYETYKWPRAMLNKNSSPTVGEKILLELKNSPQSGSSERAIQNIQTIVEKAKTHESKNDPIEQIKLLESLINWLIKFTTTNKRALNIEGSFYLVKSFDNTTII